VLRLVGARAGRGARAAGGGGDRRPQALQPPGRGHSAGTWALADPPRRPRPLPARARPDTATQQVLHRRARSLRLRGADSRLPLGLLLLQRVDLLWAELPEVLSREGGGRSR